MPEAPRIVVIGAGGHARVLAEAIRLSERQIAGHIAPEPDQTGDLGPHLGGDDAIANQIATGAFVALGLGFADAKGAARRSALLASLPPEALAGVQHPAAIVSPSSTAEPGAFIAAGAIIGSHTSLGLGSIVNTGAIVDHDCRIGANVHIATGARVAGGVSIGENTLIGTGATLRQGITIGANAIVGAGAVVIADVTPGSTVVGNPARPRGAK